VTLVVSVLSTSCTVGVCSESTTSSIAVDDVSFSEIAQGEGGPMAVGGDITYRRMTTEMGGRWADSTGEEKDVLDVLADKDFNIARIRIYNEPGNVVDDGQQLRPGWQDLADAVQNAKDAKERGMKLFVTIYYSDFWNNEPPVAWESYSQSELEAATYDWTREVMTTLKDNGVTPDYVAIGNEMQSSIEGVDRSEDPAGYYELLKQGVAGVRSVSSTTQTAVHLRTHPAWNRTTSPTGSRARPPTDWTTTSWA
jgi:arabinogalactan endo-1,4-beta-galactosidase